MRCAFLVLLALGLSVAGYGESIHWAKPAIAVADHDDEAALTALTEMLLQRLTEDGVPAFERSPGLPKLTLTFTGQSPTYYAVVQLDSGQGAPLTKALSFSAVSADLVLELARAIEATVRPDKAPAQGSPVLVDSFVLSDLKGVDLPFPGIQAVYGLSTLGDELVAAAGSSVLRLNLQWSVTAKPAKALSDQGLLNFARLVSSSPAGSLFLVPVDGSAVWYLPEGGSPSKLPIPVTAGNLFGVLSDGTPYTVGGQPARVQLGRGPLSSFDLPVGSYVFSAAAGPEATLWLADISRGSIKVYSQQGALLDVVYPDLPSGAQIFGMTVFADGSFVAAAGNRVLKFDKTGRVLWSWSPTAADRVNLAYYMSLVPGPDHLLYFNDTTSGRVFRLAEDPAALPPALAAVAKADAAVRANPRSPEALLALAEAYRAQGAPEPERVALDRYLEVRPADAAAFDRRQAVQVALLKQKAASAEADALDLARRVGPETARDAYARAMKTLEAIRALVPQDADVARRITALRKSLDDAQAPLPAPAVPRVTGVNLVALFPSLLNAYRTRAAGTLTLKNTLSENLTDVRAEVYLPKYMDFASAGPAVSKLAPGAETVLDLKALLNDQVLSVEEDVPAQVLVTVRYSDSRGAHEFSFPRPITLYRRTALTWDDTGKLASYITPNEETVAQAAFQMQGAAAGPVLVSSTLHRAQAISDALGALPLRYVPDPQSSFSAVSSDAGLVDTVRFPRTTLAYQGGDCDDTTALLASLLEASGLRTAILTSPGHVFLAFDTGEKTDAAWLMEGQGLATVAAGGTLWIPLESTVLSQGFTASWSAASDLVNRYRGTADFEFLPVATLRTTYPALPLPPSTLPVPRPAAAAFAALNERSDGDLLARVYQPLAARLETQRATLKGSEWSRLSNRLAQVHARYGRADLATGTLQEIVKRDPAFLSAYLNLASLSLASGDRDAAVRWTAAAQRVAPQSQAVSGFIAQAGLGTSGLSTPGPALAQGEAQVRAGRADAPAWVEP